MTLMFNEKEPRQCGGLLPTSSELVAQRYRERTLSQRRCDSHGSRFTSEQEWKRGNQSNILQGNMEKHKQIDFSNLTWLGGNPIDCFHRAEQVAALCRLY